MSNKYFDFKQFKVKQELCAMKVGTDSVLLGALAFVEPEVEKILDIGTGTGLLALMMAQKSRAQITAIEIDASACTQAQMNFEASKWKERLEISHTNLQNFALDGSEQFDFIISNPPYFRFNHNFIIQDKQRSLARHDQDLPFEDLAFHVHRLLKQEGKFWLILPNREAIEFIEIAGKHHLFLQEGISVQPKKSKPVNRFILCFGKVETPLLKRNFIIYDEDGKASEAYYEKTREFYLWEEKVL